MSQYIREELNEDELVYSINVWDVQTIAKEKIGRKLTFEEMNRVKKGVEWGFFDWFVVVNLAIESALAINSNKKV